MMDTNRELASERWVYRGVGADANTLQPGSLLEKTIFAPARPLHVQARAGNAGGATDAGGDEDGPMDAEAAVAEGAGGSGEDVGAAGGLCSVGKCTGLLYFELLRWMRKDGRARAARHVAAAGLAANAYRIEHGEYPRSLEMLVPDYLAAVPVDPYAAGRAPVGYSAGRSLMFTACLRMGADDTKLTPPTRKYVGDWTGMDFFYFISREPATTAPSPTSRQSG